ncbi:stage II sporulation protein M [Blastopirellula marina]|uniref:Stage II sporulation protein M n=1 Tax=Blastopirellula marina TaxID=124 RepID=A0A2S8GKF1_9BACT|nr:stage II sporulation protein M [Blastopirellula marina]PQO44906.1 stage II sporulation protein M [Blastopirellula marina]
MKVAQLIEKRRVYWQELENLCSQMSNSRKKSLGARNIARFAALYRAACADLALADSYQLPPNIVEYLHKLVGRAHGQLYRSRRIDWSQIGHMLLVRIPREIFKDRCVQLTFWLFWSVFLLCGFMAANPDRFPVFAADIAGADALDMMEQMYANAPNSGGPTAQGAAFYVNHNTGIGIQCFVVGITVIGGLGVLLYNAAFLGTIFGHMASPSVPEDTGDHFFEFVTAHGPFELTAIVLAAGAGLRIGFSLISPYHKEESLERDELPEAEQSLFEKTRQVAYERIDSLRIGAKRALPIMGASAILFTLAAMVEAWVSPSPLPEWAKQLIAILSSGLLMVYFIVLGYPRKEDRATR